MSNVAKVVDGVSHNAGLVKELIGKSSVEQAETMLRETRDAVADEVLSKDASNAIIASVSPQIKKYSDLVKARVEKYLNYTYEDPFVTGYLHIDPKEVADIEMEHAQDFFDKLTNKTLRSKIHISGYCFKSPVYDAAGNMKRDAYRVEDTTRFRFYNKDKKLLKEVVLDENGVPIYEDVYKDVIVDGEPRVRYLSYLTSRDKFTNELKPKYVNLVLREMKE